MLSMQMAVPTTGLSFGIRRVAGERKRSHEKLLLTTGCIDQGVHPVDLAWSSAREGGSPLPGGQITRAMKSPREGLAELAAEGTDQRRSE